MKVAITASDAFVAPYIIDALGDAAVVIPDEVLEDSMTLDVMLTPCNALIHTLTPGQSTRVLPGMIARSRS